MRERRKKEENLLSFKSKCKNTSSFRCSGWSSRMCLGALSIQIGCCLHERITKVKLRVSDFGLRWWTRLRWWTSRKEERERKGRELKREILPLQCVDLLLHYWRLMQVYLNRIHHSVRSLHCWWLSWWTLSTYWLHIHHSYNHRPHLHPQRPKRKCFPVHVVPVGGNILGQFSGFLGFFSGGFFRVSEVVTLITHLIDTPNNGSHGSIPRSIHRFSIIGRTPTGTINVYQIRFMSHRIGFDQIRHVRLVQHSDSGHFGIIGNTNTTNTVITLGRYFSCTPCPVRIEPVIRVPWIRKRIVAAEIVTCPGVLFLWSSGEKDVSMVRHSEYQRERERERDRKREKKNRIELAGSTWKKFNLKQAGIRSWAEGFPVERIFNR